MRNPTGGDGGALENDLAEELISFETIKYFSHLQAPRITLQLPTREWRILKAAEQRKRELLVQWAFAT